jgi:hypothetical protein
MLFANIALMPAVLAHLIGQAHWLAALPPAIIVIPISMFIAAAVIGDYLWTRRVRPLTLALASVSFASGPLFAFVVGPSEAWHRFASWLPG